MRIILVYLFSLVCLTAVRAQQKNQAVKFSFPRTVTSADYHAGKVLVKIKPQYKSLFQEGSKANGRAAMPLGANGVVSLAPAGTIKRSSARVQAYKPAIDITQYFELSFDPSIPVEEYINTLYASGYVELAEPVYTERMQFTPNDPSASVQYYLSRIRAIEAWDITEGSEDMVIAIVDSGVDIDHPDLASQLYKNTAELNGTAGVDDDNNGYIDDINGWDFSGADTLNALNPNYVGDNDPAIYKDGPGFTHGTQVGGCASAATNNGTGIAGIGFKTKLLYTKHYADNQKTSSRSYSSNLYLGVLYAAHNGARIINCSWGSTVRSQVYQDIITYVTQDLGCLVVAAAGNDNAATMLYPASYDHVLSVAASDQNDVRATFTNYNSAVDLSAPGVNIYTTAFDNNYYSTAGTSFSSPITAGAAALVWAYHPEYSAEELAEQMRVSADASFYDNNASYLNKLGKGRLDIVQALTLESPSIRALSYKLLNDKGQQAAPGEKGSLIFEFKNFLHATSSGLEISISTTSPYISITKSSITPGSIPSGETMVNTLTPFELTLSASVPENTKADLLITYSDGSYHDTQTFTFVPNPSYRDIDDNKITTTISSSGRWGYEDTENSAGGSGFVFDGQSLLYEMGLIMGNSSSSILNTVRNNNNGFDQDFVTVSRMQEIVPGERSFSEIFGTFSNSTTASEQKVSVSYHTLVWPDAPYDRFIIVEYKVKNTQATALTNFHFAMFADWDISLNGAQDAAQWDASTRLGYVFPKQSSDLPHAGIQLLTPVGSYYAIDNDPSIAGGASFGIYDGFSDTEKYTGISTTRAAAGTGTGGNDVSHIVSAGPYTINPNEEVTIAFALHAAENYDALINSAKYADSVYNYTLTAPMPVVDTIQACYGSNAKLKATGATKYNWYRDFTGGEAVAQGTQLTVSNVTNDTTLYVSNADHSYESVRTPAHIIVQAQPTILTSRSPELCEKDTVILSVEEASEYAWSNGEITQSIKVAEAGTYSVMVKYDDGTLNCVSTSDEVVVTVRPRPTSAFSITLTSGDFVVGESIQFTDNSTNAESWYWNFGDGSNSIEQSPVYAYESSNTFHVSLTVTATNGCQDTSVKDISVITGIEKDLDRFVTVYPIPTTQRELTVVVDGLKAKTLRLSLLTAEGTSLYSESFTDIHDSFSHTLNTSNYSAGIYFLATQLDGRMVVKKVAIAK
ncbi:MAG TPA: S8 family serine peptidase [Ohtaekwangia sp.]|uniref:S8 family serine peptidase n=1 Tax=Ohtaekwangia sp. TaxID=2066019 RepID=UPI002F9328BC